MAPFALKNHVNGKERVLAACDAELVGKSLAEGKLRLHVSPEFYDGFKGDEEALAAYLSRCTIANLVGQRTVDLAIELGFVAKENVLTIQGVPHAQWALLF